MRICQKVLALNALASFLIVFNILGSEKPSQGARIKLKIANVNFGEMEEGEISEQILNITNVGDEALKILKVRGS